MKKDYVSTNSEIKSLKKQLAQVEEQLSAKLPSVQHKNFAEEIRAEIKQYLKRISATMLKVVKLSGGLLVVQDGRVAFKDKIAPYPFNAEDAEAVVKEQFKRIDYCLTYMSENGVSARYVAEIGKSLHTIYAVYDSADKLENTLTKSAEDALKNRADLEKKKKDLTSKLEKLNAELNTVIKAFGQERKLFDFAEIAMPEEYGVDIVLPIGLSEQAQNILSWRLGNGVLFANSENEKSENLSSFIKALVVQFLYAFPNAGAKILHCCRNMDDDTNLFLTRMKNMIGEEFFFEKTKSFGSGGDKYSSELIEVIQRLHKLCSEDRTSLLSDSFAGSILEYNRKNPDNAQSPILAILQDYPVGFENCPNLDYLFSYGKKYGIFFVVVNGGNGLNKSAFGTESAIDAAEYADVSAEFSDGNLKFNGVGYLPLNIADSRMIELFEPLKELKEKSRGTVTYEDVGFGAEKVEGKAVTNEISIPVGKVDDKVYTMDFAVSGKDSKPVSYMIIGKPGCGKSSIIDSLIINGGMKYSPDDLNFYLIDFKDGVSSAPYIGNAKMPHIKLVAQQSKQEEAEIILKTVLREKTRRNDIFKKYDCGNLVAYNQKADERREKHLPRIIVVIDEFHAIFNDDGDAERSQRLSDYCKQIVREGRSAGIHLLITSQNADRKLMACVGDFVSGRFCFEVTNIEHAEAVFYRENAVKVVKECTGHTGTAMVSHDSGATVRKIRASYHSGYQNDYAAKVRERWGNYIIDTAVVGDDSALKYKDIKDKSELYEDLSYGAPIGISYYDGKAVYLPFDRAHSTLAVVGDSDGIQTDHLMSVMIYAAKSRARVMLVDESESLMLGRTFEGYDNVEQFTGAEYLDMLSKANAELKRRRENRRQTFEPYFVVIHSLHMINAFMEDRRGGGAQPVSDGYMSLRAMREATPSETVEGQATFLKMLKDASLVNNFYICFSIKPDEFPRRGNAANDVKTKILHHAYSPAMEYIAERLYNHKKLGMTCGKNISLMSESMLPFEKIRFYQFDENDNTINMVRRVLDNED